MPKGKSALIGAGRGLVKKGYSQKYLSSRLQINRRTLSVKQKLNKKIRINVKNIKEFYTRIEKLLLTFILQFSLLIQPH
jgi:hypothetical protein